MEEWKDKWYGRTIRLYLSGFFLDVIKPVEPIVQFSKKINGWQDKFFLPNLSKLLRQQYKRLFDNFNIDIPFHFFQRNVKAAIKQAQKITQ